MPDCRGGLILALAAIPVLFDRVTVAVPLGFVPGSSCSRATTGTGEIMAWKASHYTHLIDLAGGQGVVYNGRSGALVKLSAGAFERCKAIIEGGRQGHAIRREHNRDPLIPHLVAGSFLVEEDFDEVAFIEEQYQRERRDSQF